MAVRDEKWWQDLCKRVDAKWIWLAELRKLENSATLITLDGREYFYEAAPHVVANKVADGFRALREIIGDVAYQQLVDEDFFTRLILPAASEAPLTPKPMTEKTRAIVQRLNKKRAELGQRLIDEGPR